MKFKTNVIKAVEKRLLLQFDYLKWLNEERIPKKMVLELNAEEGKESQGNINGWSEKQHCQQSTCRRRCKR